MRRFSLCLLFALILLSACRPVPLVETPVDPEKTSTATPTAAPTPTAEPPKVLSVCTGQLPQSLFLYDGLQSHAKTNLLTILYEAPFNLVAEETQPEILARVPTLENGGINLAQVTVQRGQTVMDAEGNLAVLKAGLRIRPSGCRSEDCAVVWDGQTPIQMDQMVVTYPLREGLTWSDGTPVTAEDSLFSFRLADAPEAPGLHWAEERTADYRAENPQSVVWAGRPGFTSDDISRFFWTPLPSHVIDQAQSWSDLASSEALAQPSLSYGPFYIADWRAEEIRLSPNPYYYRADEGLPLLDEIIFRQISGAGEAAYQALESGACDILDSSFGWENDLTLLASIADDPGVKVQAENSVAWWQLVYGIRPASYDDFYNPAVGDRPDFFGSPDIRQGLAACLNREAMLAEALKGWGELWPSFLPPDETYLPEEGRLVYDPKQGMTALSTAGWLDFDEDPDTPRIAVNVNGVPAGTELKVDLLVDQTAFQQAMAAIIQESLAACGVGVNIQTLPAEQLYAPGPEGPLFGRAFDLALIAWAPGPDLDCRLYLDQAIPAPGNQWVGTNIGGFTNPAYDRACSAAALSLAEERHPNSLEAERVFLAHLPAVPLFSQPEVMVFSSALSNSVGLTTGERFFNHIETLMGD